MLQAFRQPVRLQLYRQGGNQSGSSTGREVVFIFYNRFGDLQVLGRLFVTIMVSVALTSLGMKTYEILLKD